MSTSTKTYRQAVAPEGADQRVANQLSSDKKKPLGSKPSSKRQPNKSYSSAASAGVSQTSNAINAVGAGGGEEQTDELRSLEALFRKLFEDQDVIRKQRSTLFKISVPDENTRIVYHTWATEVKLGIKWVAIYRQMRNVIESIRYVNNTFNLDQRIREWYPAKTQSKPYEKRWKIEASHIWNNNKFYQKWYSEGGVCNCAQCAPPDQTATTVSVPQDAAITQQQIPQPTQASVAPSPQMRAAHAGLQSCIDQAISSGLWGDWMLEEDKANRR